jgi:hypothetical protein
VSCLPSGNTCLLHLVYSLMCVARKSTPCLKSCKRALEITCPLCVTAGYLQFQDHLSCLHDCWLIATLRLILEPAVEGRLRLDAGTWGTMGVGLGYAIAAATCTDRLVVAVEGDSAFGFSGMEVETMSRQDQIPNLPLCMYSCLASCMRLAGQM